MKKFLALIVAVLLVLSFSACNGSSPKLSADEALNIALEQAGVSRDAIRDIENNLENDNGVLIYEIDFKSGNTEYSYDVNADTGAIVERDRDRID